MCCVIFDRRPCFGIHYENPAVVLFVSCSLPVAFVLLFVSGRSIKYLLISLHMTDITLLAEIPFKPTIGNESSHEISNDNGVRVVNFATSKNLVVKCTMFPHRSIHKYTWTSPDGKTHNQIDHILIDRR
jgi:hypothetical protein